MTAPITIIRGPRSALLHDRRLHPAGAIVLESDGELSVPWAGMRQLLGRLDQEIHVERDRAVVSLVLRGLVPELDAAERVERAERAGQLLGFLSHNGMISGPLLDALTELIAPACSKRVIAIPDVGALDPESLLLVRQLHARLAADERPTFVLGHDPEPRASEWLWRRDEDLIAGQLALLELLPGTRIETVEAAEPVAAHTPTAAPRHPLDDDLERRAYSALVAAPAPDTASCTLAIHAMRAAFACFGFTAVLRLGLELLRRAPRLGPEVAAEVHTLIALAAYNRQVETGDNAELATLLDTHFASALELETDAGRRSHLLYRLCINRGRRKGEFAEAHALGDRAVDEARAVASPGLAAFLEAWARNGRAYVRARLRRHAEAVDDCERAAELLAIAEAEPGAPRSEVRPSRLVIYDNLAMLAEMQGDRERAAHWQALSEQLEATMPETLAISAHRWARLLRAQHDLRGAIGHAERGLAEARKRLHPLVEDRYGADLGDLYYRLGDAAAAFRHFDAVLAIRRRSRDDTARLRAELSCAVAAARAGRFVEARDHLDRALAEPACAEPSARAEITAAQGLVAARAADATAAHDLLDRAIDLAVESGGRDTLLRVARMAGDACALLGERDAAIDAYERAVDIAGSDDISTGQTERVDSAGADTPPAPAAELLAVYLGLASLVAEPADWNRRALGVAPAALADPDAWWDLARLVDGAAALAEGGMLADHELASARELASLAAQRTDCRAAVDRLARAMPG